MNIQETLVFKNLKSLGQKGFQNNYDRELLNFYLNAVNILNIDTWQL